MKRVIDILLPNLKREEYINQGKCVDKPFGCGEPITSFTDTLSEKEYKISGLCQNCQDRIFAEDLDDEQTQPGQ